ncbi:MAG: GAF domain-containing SpoIIE family protein phosphatase [Calditrichia bacterium]
MTSEHQDTQLSRLEKENKRLRMAVEELSILNEIAITISSTNTLDRIVELIVQKCIKFLKVEQGAVMLLHEEDQDSPFQTMVRKADSSTMSRVLPFRLDTQLTGWMLKHREPLLINNFKEDTRFHKGEDENLAIHSLLCVPLRLKGKMTGLLTLFNKKTPEGFTVEDQRLLSIIAAQSAQIIENARLYEKEKELLRMEEQMHLAREIQLKLLPQSAPHLPGYAIAGHSVPAQEVGGDYYDFMAIDENHLAFCLGDVSGKGIPAAMLMSNLQATLRGQTLLEAIPKLCLERSNTLLFQSTDFQKFATLFYGILDTQNHALTYCNGGHDNPFLFCKQQKPLRLAIGGTVLGFVEKFSYEQETIPMEPGNVLAIYSDGVTEAMNRDEEEFGEERLARVIAENCGKSPQELINNILSAVRQFAGDAPQMDDITIVVVKRDED